MNRLVIVGASGHGKVVADIARLNGYSDIVFLDNNTEIKECSGFPVIGPDAIIPETEGDLFVAIGNADVRKELMSKYYDRVFPTLVHPSAVISKSARIGVGTVVMAGAVINPDASIGKGCIVNTCSSVDHDCNVGDYCHISVGSHLCGTVSVDNSVWIGAGATVSNNVFVCSKCIVGAGAVVINDILVSGTYVGVPSKKIK